MEGALGQRDKQKLVKGRQQTALGSKPHGVVMCAREHGKQGSARVARTRIIRTTLHKDTMGSRRALGPVRLRTG